MELVELFKDLVSNLGVPIACLAITFRLWNKEREDHKEEMKGVTEALNNNTVAIQKLSDLLDKE